MDEIADVIGGGTPRTTDPTNFEKDGIPWLTPADLSKNKSTYIRRGERNISEKGLRNSSAQMLPRGAVLFTSRAPIGYCVIAANEISTNQGFKSLVLIGGILPEYIRHYLLSAKGYAESLASGSTFKELSKKRVQAIEVPITSIAEQGRIVAKIEELFTKLDAGVEALKKTKAQLKRYRQSVLKAAVEGKLTEEWREAHKGEIEPASVLLERIKKENIAQGKAKDLPSLDPSQLPILPDGWTWAQVRDIGYVITGSTPSKSKAEYYGNDFPFFKPADLNDGYYVRESEDGLSKEGIKKARLLPTKSILVTCIGATIGKTGFIRTDGASNQQINTIIPKKGILHEFIYFMSVSPFFQESIINNASSTTLPILNKGRFEILSVPLPPFKEQKAIVEEIDRRLSVADEIEATIAAELKRSERLRHSILKQAFSGKLVPQDPTDEPAEKLLERIREEKARMEAEKKPRRRAKAHRKTK